MREERGVGGVVTPGLILRKGAAGALPPGLILRKGGSGGRYPLAHLITILTGYAPLTHQGES